jgi:hypothetical protein
MTISLRAFSNTRDRGLIYTLSLILSFPPFAPSLSLRDRELAADLTFLRTHNSMDYPPVLHILICAESTVNDIQITSIFYLSSVWFADRLGLV